MSNKQKTMGPGPYLSTLAGSCLFGAVFWAIGYTPQQSVLYGIGSAVCVFPAFLFAVFFLIGVVTVAAKSVSKK